MQKGRKNNAVQALKIWRRRRMSTSTVPSAMEWRQPSRLPTTSSRDICKPACKLHKRQASKLRFVTPDEASSMNTLWQEEEFEQIWSRESLTDTAAEIEKTISVKENERGRHDFDPTTFYENYFGIKGQIA